MSYGNDFLLFWRCLCFSLGVEVMMVLSNSDLAVLFAERRKEDKSKGQSDTRGWE